MAVGVPLFLMTMLGWIIGWCWSAYLQAQAQPSPIKLFPYPQMVRFLGWIWSWQLWGLPVGRYVVQNAPTPLPRSGWDAFWMILFFISALFVDRAHRLRHSLAQARDEAQRQMWVDERLGRRPGASAGVSLHVGDVSLQMGMVPDSWYARPLGIILIAVIGGLLYTLIGQYIMRALGWAH